MNTYYNSRDHEGVRVGWKTITGLAVATVALNISAGFVADARIGAEKAEDFANGSGYSDARVTEVNHIAVGLQGCDQKDAVGYEMTAKNSAGDIVNIIACGGLFKGLTLRSNE
ncbi:MAG: hypothetical protein QG629_545 [Patescibacteria group bacterium]|nr:hypothetical protein [Candidatus Saccharibacteria bacterium]MDQ5963463.1 hypothetical protein [Patescibacteria group bacterium]